MASFMDDANEILNKVEARVHAALLNDCAPVVQQAIRESVYQNVYPLYSPSLYVRRMDEGGLTDVSRYDVYLDPATHTLTVADDRHEVGVVERGIGYTWEESRIYRYQPYPRPYFAPAEEAISASGVLDSLLQNALDTI